MKKIFVLGGTGFLGGHVCEKLTRAGFALTVATRRAVNGRKVQHLPGLTLQEMDVHDKQALEHAVSGHDAVVNLVAILHGNSESFAKAHVTLPKKILAACQANEVRRLVHISALGADALNPENRPSEYLRSKSRGEALLLAAASSLPELDLTIIRPSVIFGADDKFLNLFAKLQAVFPIMPLAGANARFQPVWVEDVALGVVRALQRGVRGGECSETIEACGPNVLTLRELVQMAARLSGAGGSMGRPVIALPEWVGRLQARLMELAPGEPLMSRDNLDSMKVDNIASGTLPGLGEWGIAPAALEPIARHYLGR
jgi:NADH dehydrogenase